MGQRIAVRAFVTKQDKFLIIKRTAGRSSLLGRYELPGGRVNYKEQPEEALNRLLEEHIGLTADKVYLSDVLTYDDPDRKDTQYAVIVYTVKLPDSPRDIRLGQKFSHYKWIERGLAHEQDLTDLSKVLIDIRSHKDLNYSPVEAFGGGVDLPAKNSAIIFSDGGSRGNPGPSAAGFVIMDTDSRIISEGGAYLGITTNNQAEYHGVHLGLKKAKELGIKVIEFRLDSMLVVNQLNGLYVIRNRELWPINERVRSLIGEFDKVSFRHIKRELNQQADSMVNKILDAHGKKKL